MATDDTSRVLPYTTWADVDLDALEDNLRVLEARAGRAQLICVVKANAYGHGIRPVARHLQKLGVDHFAVGRIEEGIELRNAGIRGRILVLGPAHDTALEKVLEHRLTPSVGSLDQARLIDSLARAAGTRAPIHVKVDSGMTRYGVLVDEAATTIREIERLESVLVEGVFTHFACADDLESDFTSRQLERFRAVIEELRTGGIEVPVVHAANSAATIAEADARLNACRVGLALYGLSPFESGPEDVPLRPVMSIHARVSRVVEVPEGTGVSYGLTFVTDRPTRLALIPHGYGDGYLRGNQARGYVLIHGERCPIRGRVCMDQFVVECPAETRTGDVAVLLGKQGDEEIPAETIAGWTDTIHYEVVTGTSSRLPRVYRGGTESSGESPEKLNEDE